MKGDESATKTTMTIGGFSTTDILSTSSDGTVMTTTKIGGWTTEITTNSYVLKVEIDKDGTYKHTVVSDGNTNTFPGYWWWLSDAKKKTRIAFDDDKSSYEIDMLKLKEMTFIFSTELSYVSMYNMKSEGTKTFEKE